MKTAKIISLLTHPWLMPLFGVFLLFHSGTWFSLLPAKAMNYVYLVTVSFTIVLPLFITLFLKKRNLLSHLDPSDASERRIPLMLTSFFTLLAAFILQKSSAPLTIPLYLNGISIVILIAAMISGFWNISTHMIGLGAVLGLILAISLKWMIDLRLIMATLIILSGIAATARLNLQTHKPAQVYSGFALGVIPLFLLIWFI